MVIQQDLFCFYVISYVAFCIHSASFVSCTYKKNPDQRCSSYLSFILLFYPLLLLTRSISTSPGDKNNGVKVWQLGVGLASNSIHALED